MEVKKVGQFLATLRKEKGLTQDELGQRVGVTNKTVSRWETGSYLPPAESLEVLSDLYGLTINEILSGQRLDASQYQQKAEENIAAVMKHGNFSRREKFLLIGEWLSQKWWLVLLCLCPALFGYFLIPFVVGEHMDAVLYATLYLIVGLVLICSHLVSYLAEQAYMSTKDTKEFRVLKLMRIIWLLIFVLSLFVCIELCLSTLHAMTPAGRADGYAVTSIFYDILIADHGNYLDNCWIALKRALWQCFAAAVINIDLTILWMKKKCLQRRERPCSH